MFLWRSLIYPQYVTSFSVQSKNIGWVTILFHTRCCALKKLTEDTAIYLVPSTCQVMGARCFTSVISGSVQFSRSVMSDSLWPHERHHARPPGPSPTLGVYPNSCPLSQWCHPTISSSVIPFSSCLQSFPTSGSFQKSQLFASGGHNIGVSASTSVLPVNTQDWFPQLMVPISLLWQKGKLSINWVYNFLALIDMTLCMKLLLSCILILHCNIVHSQARGRIFSQVKYY